LLDTITSTEDSKDCPGVCVHTLATLICYEVLENVKCPSPTMRCCVEPPPLPTNGTTAAAAANKVDQTTPSVASSARPQVSESRKEGVCVRVCDAAVFRLFADLRQQQQPTAAEAGRRQFFVREQSG